MLSIEQTRLQVSKKTDASKKSQFGQFFTPAKTALFMASLFPDAHGSCRLLDAGAGIGSLSDAFLERWRLGGFHFRRVELDAFEIDDSLRGSLKKDLREASKPVRVLCSSPRGRFYSCGHRNTFWWFFRCCKASVHPRDPQSTLQEDQQQFSTPAGPTQGWYRDGEPVFGLRGVGRGTGRTGRFIHVPTTTEKSAIELSPAVRYALADLGIKISTGPVVDFRLKEHLRDMPEEGTVPLIYPGHLRITGTVWPMPGLKKPNAIMRNAETEKWFYPNGFYCVVRRFSSKEEKRRVVASVVDPAAFGNHTVLGFENHMNLFHENKRGLPELLARGLAAFLNTTAVDENFRRFSGHTQVNATDLKQMLYPSREVLTQLGQWAKQHSEITQKMMDEQLGKLTA